MNTTEGLWWIKKEDLYAGKNILFSPERGMFLTGEEQECNIANQVWMVFAHVMNVEENRTIMTRAVKGAVSCKRYFNTLYVPLRDRGSF